MLFVNLPVYLAVLLGACTVGAYFLWKLYTRTLRTRVNRVRRLPATTTAGARRRTANPPVHRRPTDRMRSAEAEQSARQQVATDDPAGTSGDDASSGQSETPKKKVGTKKAAKLAEKERRKEEREADERYREHQRKLEDQAIAKRKKEEEEEERAAAEAAAAEAKRREEEEAREQAEYERMKREFDVEQEGIDSVTLGAEAESELNASLIAAITQAKIIAVEHLALQFNMKTDACVDRLKELLATGQLTGLMDDRGKFVHITEAEYERIAQFIERRGRVSLAELAENGRHLLDLTPLMMKS